MPVTRLVSFRLRDQYSFESLCSLLSSCRGRLELYYAASDDGTRRGTASFSTLEDESKFCGNPQVVITPSVVSCG